MEQERENRSGRLMGNEWEEQDGEGTVTVCTVKRYKECLKRWEMRDGDTLG